MYLISLDFTLKKVKMINFILCIFYHNSNKYPETKHHRPVCSCFQTLLKSLSSPEEGQCTVTPVFVTMGPKKTRISDFILRIGWACLLYRSHLQYFCCVKQSFTRQFFRLKISPQRCVKLLKDWYAKGPLEILTGQCGWGLRLHFRRTWGYFSL